jgi:hypothetical protein
MNIFAVTSCRPSAREPRMMDVYLGEQSNKFNQAARIDISAMLAPAISGGASLIALTKGRKVSTSNHDDIAHNDLARVGFPRKVVQATRRRIRRMRSERSGCTSSFVVIIKAPRHFVNDLILRFRRGTTLFQGRFPLRRITQISRLHQHGSNSTMPQLQEQPNPILDSFDMRGSWARRVLFSNSACLSRL